ncbi:MULTISPECIES: hypothetical protein [Mesorhizobium]|uniref:hypothetical protein n=1 Tax=Mesorhizobium TaxID=68287 RepID=UPI0010A95537|nr:MULTISPECIES: hypothetical protein [Mesorhizobium]
MAKAEIVRVETPEGNAVRDKDPVTVGVTVAPGWFDDPEDLVIKFIYAVTLEGTDYLSVYHDEITVEYSTEINFKVKAEYGASPGEYYVQIKKKSSGETIASDPDDGTITVS